jgi:hypothetical protein
VADDVKNRGFIWLGILHLLRHGFAQVLGRSVAVCAWIGQACMRSRRQLSSIDVSMHLQKEAKSLIFIKSERGFLSGSHSLSSKIRLNENPSRSGVAALVEEFGQG